MKKLAKTKIIQPMLLHVATIMYKDWSLSFK